jgi:hypothetical protein
MEEGTEMFRDREQMRQRLHEIIEKFRQKGAINPEKALTIQELGLPSRFEQAMHRRLGQSGIFVEVNGKYYLNEERLKQIQEQRVREGSASKEEDYGMNRGQPPSWYRLVGIFLMLPIGIIVALLLVYFVGFGGSYYPGQFLIILLIVALLMFMARLLFWRSRRRYWRGSSI